MSKITAFPDQPPRPVMPTAADEAYDMRIARDGTWFYHGSPIGRIALVKLFSTVLRRDEAGDYWLITPAERGRIKVEDVPFVAVEVRATGEEQDQSLAFRTNLDDWVTAGPANPIRVAYDQSGSDLPRADLNPSPRPYILVRDRLEARISRTVFYDLVSLAVEQEGPQGSELGVWSEGIFFSLGALPPTDPSS
jgi:hypothetical protein